MNSAAVFLLLGLLAATTLWGEEAAGAALRRAETERLNAQLSSELAARTRDLQVKVVVRPEAQDRAEENAADPHALGPPAQSRGGRVGWGRLSTPGSQWGRHGDQDPRLARFIADQTTLNLDRVWYAVEPDTLDHLCTYPFIFAKDLLRIADPDHLKNLREYLRRGGFLCIDPCVNGFSESAKESLTQQYGDLFTRLFPDCRMRELPDDHEIYRCYFPVTVDGLYTPDLIRAGGVKPPHIGMRGVFLGDRMIAVVSITGLECGWPETPQRVPACMKMITNVYVYAMTR